MFGTIRKHQNWLWFIIVTVIIVSFVIYFDPSVGSRGRGGGGSGIGRLNGRDITRQQYEEAGRETRLLYFLNFRKWPEQDETAHQRGFDLEREATLRLVRVAEAKRAGIEIADSTVAAYAKRLLGDFPPQRFAEEVLRPAGLTLDDFERFVRNDAALQQLSSLQGMAGRLVPPAEVEALYRRENQAMAGEVALFTISNYVPRVSVSNEALTTWYSNQMARYRTPEQIRVSYVEFPRTNFMAEATKQIDTVTNLTLQLEQMWLRDTNAWKDTNGNVLPREKAVQAIKQEQIELVAEKMAQRRAIDFANKLYEAANKDEKVNPAALEEVLKTETNVVLKVTPPFDMENGPTNLNVGPNFSQAAFTLNTNNPIAFQPVQGEDGFYLLALKDTIPSRPQSYEEVKQQVADDYKQTQAFIMLQQEAREFQSKLTNAMAQGKSFADVATESKVKVIALPPIARNTETLTNLGVNLNARQIRSVLFSLEAGKTSGVIPNPPEGAYIAHLKQKLPIDEAKMKEELTKFAQEIRFARQNDVFNNWFRKRIEKLAPDLPLLQTRQQQQPPRG